MIGLIFGETSFPIEILKKIKKKRLNYLIIDLSKSKKFKKDKKSYSVSIGEFGKIINILKLKEKPVMGPLLIVILLILIVLIASFKNNIIPFIYTAF